MTRKADRIQSTYAPASFVVSAWRDVAIASTTAVAVKTRILRYTLEDERVSWICLVVEKSDSVSRE